MTRNSKISYIIHILWRHTGHSAGVQAFGQHFDRRSCQDTFKLDMSGNELATSKALTKVPHSMCWWKGPTFERFLTALFQQQTSPCFNTRFRILLESSRKTAQWFLNRPGICELRKEDEKFYMVTWMLYEVCRSHSNPSKTEQTHCDLDRYDRGVLFNNQFA